MKKHALLTNALVAMMLFLVMSSVVAVNAQTTTTGDDDDDDTTTETETEDSSDDDDDDRTLQVDVTATEAEIQSKLKSGTNEDTFRIRIRTDDNGVEFKVAYELENSTSETEHEFEVEFQELVEYVDTNGNGVYDDDVDADVQVMELSTFNPIVYTLVNGTDGDIHIFEISTTDGIFTVRTFATGEFESINGTIVAPTQMKIDILINGFNYTEDNSSLALKVKLEASTETSFDEDTEDEEDGRAVDEAAVDIAMSQFNGFFSWKETAEIDGIVYPVNSSIDEVSVHEQKIYLNYQRGDVIIHDPKVGFENILSSPAGSGNPLPFGDLLQGDNLPIVVAAVAAIAVIGVILVVRRRS